MNECRHRSFGTEKVCSSTVLKSADTNAFEKITAMIVYHLRNYNGKSSVTFVELNDSIFVKNV